MNPLAVRAGHDALRAQNRAEAFGVFEHVQLGFQLFHGELFGRFNAPADEYFVRVVAVMMVMMMLVLVFMFMFMFMFMFIVIVIIVVMMMAAAAALIVVIVVIVMVVMMLVLIFIVVIIVVVVMLVLVVIVVVMMMFANRAHVLILAQMLQFGFQRVAVLHRFQNLRAVERVPVGRDDYGRLVLLAQHGDHVGQLLFVHIRRSRQDDRSGVLHLIVEELAEVLHIHFALFRVDNGGEAVQRDVVLLEALYGADYVAELAHAGGLNENAVRGVLLHHFLQRLAEIAHEAAADAALAHFGHFNARVLHEAAVDADLAELVFNQHQLFALKRFRNQLLDQRRLARSEEPGENINLCHRVSSLSILRDFHGLSAVRGIIPQHGKFVNSRFSPYGSVSRSICEVNVISVTSGVLNRRNAGSGLSGLHPRPPDTYCSRLAA